jgi:hypothetical protein
MKATCSSETLADFLHTACCYIPEDRMCNTRSVEVNWDDIYYTHFGKHHCPILVYQCPLMCAIVVNKQHIIISSTFRLGPLFLTRRVAALR